MPAQGAGGRYVTWDTVEPDKCIAAWLIRAHVDPSAEFVFVASGAPVGNGIRFDIPGSRYARDHRRCASEAVIEIHGIRDAKAVALGRLARKMEMGMWCAAFTEKEAPLAEKLTVLWESKAPCEQRLAESFASLDAWEP